MIRLLAVIENKEVEDYIDALRIKESKKGHFISSDEFEKKWDGN